jgi:DNA replication protein DnaC
MKRINLADNPFFDKSTTQDKSPRSRSQPQKKMPLNVAPEGQCCDGTGWYLRALPHDHPEFGKLIKCECGRAGNPHIKLTNLQNDLKAYSHCTFEKWDLQRKLESFQYNGVSMSIPNQQTTLQIATRRAKAYANAPGGWLYIHGSYGAGKTHMAAAIGHEVVMTGKTVVYRNMPSLLDNLRTAIGNHNLDAMIDKFVSADLLILDDMGVEELTSEFMSARMFRIFDERMEKATIITSNLDLDDLQNKVGGRIGSRLLQSSKIYLPLSDFRKYKRKDI